MPLWGWVAKTIHIGQGIMAYLPPFSSLGEKILLVSYVCSAIPDTNGNAVDTHMLGF
jgi:hypothetical protein